MDTLITLGSLSAMLMAIFFSVMYQYQESKESDESLFFDDSKREQRLMRIKMIMHMFETASLILIIIQFGKFLEVKAKESIIQMT